MSSLEADYLNLGDVSFDLDPGPKLRLVESLVDEPQMAPDRDAVLKEKYGLKEAELRVLGALAGGVSVEEIAQQEHLLPGGVYSRLSSSYEKIGVGSKVEAILWAQQELLGVEVELGHQWLASNGLSIREIEIFSLIARGFTNTAIAEKLSIKAPTVHGHISSINKKLHISQRSEIIDMAKGFDLPVLTVAGEEEQQGESNDISPEDYRLLMLLGSGLVGKQIALQEGVTAGSIDTRLARLYKKMGVEGRFQASLWARRELLEEDVAGIERLVNQTGLTHKEYEVLQLIMEGTTSNSVIADRLMVSEETVRTHRKAVYKKLDAHSTEAAVGAALKIMDFDSKSESVARV